MEETESEWFKSQSEEKKLIHLSKLMYCNEENAKTEFERLLSLYENLYLKLMEKAKEFNDKIQSQILEICEARKELRDLWVLKIVIYLLAMGGCINFYPKFKVVAVYLYIRKFHSK